METQKVNFVAELPDVVIGKLENIQSQVNDQLTDVQLMLSHSDIQTQKQQLKTRELQLELQLLKKNIEQGQLAPMIEKLVYQCIEKAQSSEPHSFRGGKESGQGGSMKEFVVMSDEIKILQSQLRELNRGIRIQGDEINESRARINMVMSKLEEKAQKGYVDYHFATFAQKESLSIIYDKLDLYATKIDMEGFQSRSTYQIDQMIREIERFKRVYCGKEEIHIVLNKHIEENKHSFFPREEFLAYKEKVEGTNTVIMGAVDSSNKMMRTIDKEFKEINQTLHNKPDRSEFKKLQEENQKYATYLDLKDLYNKVVPMVAKFEDRLVEQLRELAITKGMIERLDEIVSIKANKTTVDDLVFRMRKLATIEMLKQSEDSYDGQMSGIVKQVEAVKRDHEIFTLNIQREIMAAVRKQTASIRNQLLYHRPNPNEQTGGGGGGGIGGNGGGGGSQQNSASPNSRKGQANGGESGGSSGGQTSGTGAPGTRTFRKSVKKTEVYGHLLPAEPQPEKPAQSHLVSVGTYDIKKLIDSKIDRLELENLLETKANKVDTSRALRNMDIIHSQLSHILVLLVEFVRLAGLGPPQSEKLDTEKNRTHRRLFLFTHAERISRWVHTFDPSDRSLENIGLLEEQLLAQVQEFRNRAKINNFEVPYSLMAVGEELQGHRHFSDNNLASASRYTAKRQNRRDRNLSQNIMSADSMNDDEAINQLMMSPPNSLRGGIPSQIRNRLMLEKSKLYSSQHNRTVFSQGASHISGQDVVASRNVSKEEDDEPSPPVLRNPTLAHRQTNRNFFPGAQAVKLQPSSIASSATGFTQGLMNQSITEHTHEHILVSGQHPISNPSTTRQRMNRNTKQHLHYNAHHLHKSLEALKDFQQNFTHHQASILTARELSPSITLTNKTTQNSPARLHPSESVVLSEDK